jgi:hypothetical protein
MMVPGSMLRRYQGGDMIRVMMPGQVAAEEVYQEMERLFSALARRDFIDPEHKKCIHDT